MSASILQIDTSTAGIAFGGGSGNNRSASPGGAQTKHSRGGVSSTDNHMIVGLDAAVGTDLDKFIRAHTPSRSTHRDISGNTISGDCVFDDLSTLTSGDINSVHGIARLPRINNNSNSSATRSVTKYDLINGGASPFAEDQTVSMRNFNNTSSIYKEEKAKKDASAMFARAVSNLPQEKATTLLHALAELETTLRLEGVARVDEYGERIKYDYGIGIADGGHNSPTSMIGGGTDMMSISSNVSLSSSASSIFGTESVMSRYSIDKKYGRTNRSDAKEICSVLKKIGEAMHANQEDFRLLGYDLTGRGLKDELLGPTLLSQRIMSEIKLALSTKEVTLMMKKFDVDNRGVVDITAVLGSAKSVYESHLSRLQARESDKKKEHDRKVLLKQRTDYKDKTESNEAMDDAIHVILRRVRIYAFEAMRKRNMKILHECKRVIDVPAFHTLLFDLGVILSSRQIRILMKRYHIGQTNTVDTLIFKKEFIALGQDLLKEIRKAEAVQNFIESLSKGNDKPIEAEKKRLEDKELKKGIASGSMNSSKNNKNGDKAPYRGERMTLEKAEIWLADPLTAPVTGSKNKNQVLLQQQQHASSSNSGLGSQVKPRSAEKLASGSAGRSHRLPLGLPTSIVSAHRPRSAEQQPIMPTESRPSSRADSRPTSQQTYIAKPRTAEALRKNVAQHPDIFEESFVPELSY